MESKVYSKNDILQKLAQDGFFVDYLTLDSFLAKYKLEAIFEDENGNEFFDKSAYDTLVENVLHRSKKQEKKEEIELAENDGPEFFIEEENSTEFQEEKAADCMPVRDTDNILDSIVLSDGSKLSDAIAPLEPKDDNGNSGGLEDIKWHNWNDVSAGLKIEEDKNPPVIISSDENNNGSDDNESVIEIENEPDNTKESEPQTQENYWNSDNSGENELQFTSPDDAPVEEDTVKKPDIQEILSSAESESEEDFDDIGLLSDSIQVQEKFQNYIVNELAKKNIDVSPPKAENAFKLDVSEKTLNMVARAIAKKIARQVSQVLAVDQQNNTKLLQSEQKNQILEAKVNTLEEQNRKLKLLLVESNKNLNSYKPTFFGFYRFVRKKVKKRK